jgi:hypothetical protein
MVMKFLLAIAVVLLPAMAEAADITGVPKIREADQIQIGSTRIRLGGIDAPSVDQLCLNTKGERWTCGAAARDELIKYVGNKSWTCQTRAIVAAAVAAARSADVEAAGGDSWRWRCPHHQDRPDEEPPAKVPDGGTGPSSP